MASGGNSGSVALALNLMPFAGIAFLWFIGVLRNRLGPMEDQFFATVFFVAASYSSPRFSWQRPSLAPSW